MKRTVANLITFLFLGFLLIGIISVLQNVLHDVQRTFSYAPIEQHILAYQK